MSSRTGNGWKWTEYQTSPTGRKSVSHWFATVKEHLQGPACKSGFWWCVPRYHPSSTHAWVTEDQASSSFMHCSLTPQLCEEPFSCRIITGTPCTQFFLFKGVGYFREKIQHVGRLCERRSRLVLGVGTSVSTIHFLKKCQEGYSSPKSSLKHQRKPFKGREATASFQPVALHICYWEGMETETWVALVTWVTLARSGDFLKGIFFTGVSIPVQSHKPCAEGQLSMEVPA